MEPVLFAYHLCVKGHVSSMSDPISAADGAADTAAQDAPTEEHTDTQQSDTTQDAPISGRSEDAVEDSSGEEPEETPVSEENDADSDVDDTPEEGADTAKLLKSLRKKNSENRNLRDRALAAERKVLQFQTAAEVGLPLELAVRLQGATVEEMTKDAETLRGLLGRRHYVPGQPSGDGIRRHEADALDEDTDLTTIGERIYRN